MRRSWQHRLEGLRGNLPRLIWGGTLATCAILAGYVLWLVSGNYQQTVERAKERTRNSVQLVEQHTARTFDTIELLIRTVAAETSSRDPDASARVQALVSANARTLPYLRGVSVIDQGSGAVLFRFPGSGDPAPPIEQSAYLASQDPARGRLLLDAPLRDESGRWLLG
jgi:hypothetical protein